MKWTLFSQKPNKFQQALINYSQATIEERPIHQSIIFELLENRDYSLLNEHPSELSHIYIDYLSDTLRIFRLESPQIIDYPKIQEFVAHISELKLYCELIDPIFPQSCREIFMNRHLFEKLLAFGPVSQNVSCTPTLLRTIHSFLSIPANICILTETINFQMFSSFLFNQNKTEIIDLVYPMTKSCIIFLVSRVSTESNLHSSSRIGFHHLTRRKLKEEEDQDTQARGEGSESLAEKSLNLAFRVVKDLLRLSPLGLSPTPCPPLVRDPSQDSPLLDISPLSPEVLSQEASCFHRELENPPLERESQSCDQPLQTLLNDLLFILIETIQHTFSRPRLVDLLDTLQIVLIGNLPAQFDFHKLGGWARLGEAILRTERDLTNPGSVPDSVFEVYLLSSLLNFLVDDIIFTTPNPLLSSGKIQPSHLPLSGLRHCSIWNHQSLSVLTALISSGTTRLLHLSVKAIYSLILIHPPNIVSLEKSLVIKSLNLVFISLYFENSLRSQITASDDSLRSGDYQKPEVPETALLPIFSDIIVLFQLIAVVTSLRDCSYLSLLSCLLYASDLAPLTHGPQCQESGVRCQNCEIEPASTECIQCVHDENISCFRLCLECDRVFHKSLAKKSHLRIPVLKTVIARTESQPSVSVPSPEIRLRRSSSPKKLPPFDFDDSTISSSLDSTSSECENRYKFIEHFLSSPTSKFLNSSAHSALHLYSKRTLAQLTSDLDPDLRPFSERKRDSRIYYLLLLSAGIRGLVDDRKARQQLLPLTFLDPLLYSFRRIVFHKNLSFELLPHLNSSATSSTIRGKISRLADFCDDSSLPAFDCLLSRLDLPCDQSSPPEDIQKSPRRHLLSIMIQIFARFVVEDSLVCDSSFFFDDPDESTTRGNRSSTISSVPWTSTEFKPDQESQEITDPDQFLGYFHSNVSPPTSDFKSKDRNQLVDLIRQHGLEVLIVHLIIGTQPPSTLVNPSSIRCFEVGSADRQFLVWTLRELLLRASETSLTATQDLLSWFSWMLGTVQPETGSSSSLIPPANIYLPVKTRLEIVQELRLLLGPLRIQHIEPNPFLQSRIFSLPPFVNLKSLESQAQTSMYLLQSQARHNSLQPQAVQYHQNRVIFQYQSANCHFIYRSPTSPLVFKNLICSTGLLGTLVLHVFGSRSNSRVAKILFDVIDPLEPLIPFVSSTKFPPKSQSISECDIEDWWCSLAAFSQIIAGCPLAKQTIQSTFGILPLAKKFLKLSEVCSTNNSDLSSLLVSISIELCCNEGELSRPTLPFSSFTIRCPSFSTQNSPTSPRSETPTIAHLFSRNSISGARTAFDDLLDSDSDHLLQEMLTSYNPQTSTPLHLSPLYYVKDRTLSFVIATLRPSVLSFHSESFSTLFSLPKFIVSKCCSEPNFDQLKRSTSQDFLSDTSSHAGSVKRQSLRIQTQSNELWENESVSRSSFIGTETPLSTSKSPFLSTQSIATISEALRSRSFSFSPSPSVLEETSSASSIQQKSQTLPFQNNDDLTSSLESRFPFPPITFHSQQLPTEQYYCPILSTLSWGWGREHSVDKVLVLLHHALLIRSGLSREWFEDEMLPAIPEDDLSTCFESESAPETILKSKISPSHHNSDNLSSDLHPKDLIPIDSIYHFILRKNLLLYLHLDHRSSIFSDLSVPWSSNYSQLEFHSKETLLFFISLTLVSEGVTQRNLLSNLSLLLIGNPENLNLLTRTSLLTNNLIRLFITLDEAHRATYMQFLSQILHHNIDSDSSHFLISIIKHLSDRILSPTEAHLTDLCELRAQLLFILGKSTESPNPTKRLHFIGGSALQSRISLPPITTVSDLGLGLNITFWAQPCSVGSQSISSLMQLSQPSDPTVPVIDIFFRTMIKSTIDQPAPKRFLQLCVSFGRKDQCSSSPSNISPQSKDFPSLPSPWDSAVCEFMELSASPLSIGHDSQDCPFLRECSVLSASLTRFAIPDAIIQFEWTELGEWHLVSLNFSSNELQCCIDGRSIPILFWSPLGYQQIPGPVSTIPRHPLEPKVISEFGSPSLPRLFSKVSADQPILICLGGLEYEKSAFETIANSLSTSINNEQLSLLLQSHLSSIGSFTGSLGQLVILEGSVNHDLISKLHSDGPADDLHHLCEDPISKRVLIQLFATLCLADPQIKGLTRPEDSPEPKIVTTNPIPLRGLSQSASPHELRGSFVQTNLLFDAISIYGGFRFLFPFLRVDSSLFTAALQIISNMMKSKHSTFDEFFRSQTDKVIMHTCFMRPNLFSLEGIQILFDLAIQPLNRSTSTMKACDFFIRPRILKLLESIILVCPSQIDLSTAFIDFLSSICDDSSENSLLVLDNIGLLPVIVILSNWSMSSTHTLRGGAASNSNSSTSTTNKQHQSPRPSSNGKKSAMLEEVPDQLAPVSISKPISRRISDREPDCVPKDKEEESHESQDSLSHSVSQPKPSAEQMILMQKLQSSVSKLFRILITGTSGEPPLSELDTSMMVKSPTGFSSAHFLSLISYSFFCLRPTCLSSSLVPSSAQSSYFSKKKTETSPQRSKEEEVYDQYWSNQTGIQLLSLIRTTSQGQVAPLVCSLIKQSLPGEGLWLLSLELLGSELISVKLLSLRLLAISLANQHGQLDPILLNQFEKLDYFNAFSHQIEKNLPSHLSDEDSENVFQALLGLFFWRCGIAYSHSQARISSLHSGIDELSAQPAPSLQESQNATPKHSSQPSSSPVSAQQPGSVSGIMSLFTWGGKGSHLVKAEEETLNHIPGLIDSSYEVMGGTSHNSSIGDQNPPENPSSLASLDPLELSSPSLVSRSEAKLVQPPLLPQSTFSQSEVIRVPSFFQSILVLIPYVKSPRIIQNIIQQIERSVVQSSTNRKALLNQPSWLNWIVESLQHLLKKLKQLEEENYFQGSLSHDSGADSTSESGGRDCVSVSDSSFLESEDSMSQTSSLHGLSMGSNSESFMAQYTDPLLNFIQTILIEEAIAPSDSSVSVKKDSAKWMDILKLSCETEEIIHVICTDLFESIEKQSTSSEESFFSCLQQLGKLLEKLVDQLEITLDFGSRLVHGIHSLTFKCPASIRKRIHLTSLPEVRRQCVALCLLDRSEELPSRAGILRTLQSSIQNYLTSSDAKILTNSQVILLLLVMLLEATDNADQLLDSLKRDQKIIIGEDHSDYFKISTLPSFSEPEDGPGTDMGNLQAFHSALHSILTLIQLCGSSLECKKILQRIAADLPGDPEQNFEKCFVKAFQHDPTTPARTQSDSIFLPIETETPASVLEAVSSPSTSRPTSSSWFSWYSTSEPAAPVTSSPPDLELGFSNVQDELSFSSSTSQRSKLGSANLTRHSITKSKSPSHLSPESLGTDSISTQIQVQDNSSFLDWFFFEENRALRTDLKARILKEISKPLRQLESQTSRAKERKQKSTQQSKSVALKEKVAREKKMRTILDKIFTQNTTRYLQTQRETDQWVSNLHSKIDLGKVLLNPDRQEESLHLDLPVSKLSFPSNSNLLENSNLILHFLSTNHEEFPSTDKKNS